MRLHFLLDSPVASDSVLSPSRLSPLASYGYGADSLRLYVASIDDPSQPTDRAALKNPHIHNMHSQVSVIRDIYWRLLRLVPGQEYQGLPVSLEDYHWMHRLVVDSLHALVYHTHQAYSEQQH